MISRFRYPICFGLLFAFTGLIHAALISIDFDDLPAGAHLTNQYASEGVTFSGHDYGGDRPIGVGMFGSAPGTIVLDSYCNGDGFIQANFTVPVDYVAVDFMPFESFGLDGLNLSLYDAGGTMILQETMNNVSLDQWYTVSAQSLSTNVAYARFYCGPGGLPGSVNAVYNDNFIFGTSAVPEPGMISLLGFSILVLYCISLYPSRKGRETI